MEVVMVVVFMFSLVFSMLIGDLKYRHQKENSELLVMLKKMSYLNSFLGATSLIIWLNLELNITNIFILLVIFLVSLVGIQKMYTKLRGIFFPEPDEDFEKLCKEIVDLLSK